METGHYALLGKLETLVPINPAQLKYSDCFNPWPEWRRVLLGSFYPLKLISQHATRSSRSCLEN